LKLLAVPSAAGCVAIPLPGRRGVLLLALYCCDDPNGRNLRELPYSSPHIQEVFQILTQRQRIQPEVENAFRLCHYQTTTEFFFRQVVRKVNAATLVQSLFFHFGRFSLTRDRFSGSGTSDTSARHL